MDEAATKEKIAKEIFDYIVAINIDGEEPDIRDIRAIVGKHLF